MSKRKPKMDNRLTNQTDDRIVEPVPRSRSFVAPDCSMCIELRPKPIESYVRVYATVRGENGITRYCKCSFCGNTFKSVTSYQ